MTSVRVEQVEGRWVVHYTVEVIGTGRLPSDAWLEVSQQLEDLQAHADHAREMAAAAWRKTDGGER